MATTWNDALEKRFLLEIIEHGSANAETFGKIATKWGKPHTKGSLSIKLTRMRAAYGKEKQATGGPTATPPQSAEKKKGGRKRKIAEEKIRDDSADLEDAGQDAKKLKGEDSRSVKEETDSA